MIDHEQKITITDAEWKVMRLLWDRSPRSSSDLATDLEAREGWKSTTVKTLISRLQAKGAVEVAGTRPPVYAPVLSEARAVQGETRTLAQKLFGGRRGALAVRFVEEADLSPDELAELRDLIDRRLGREP